jgi:hypothetical protein
MTFPKTEKKELLQVLTRSGISCKVFLIDGVLQMISCTSEKLYHDTKITSYVYKEKYD